MQYRAPRGTLDTLPEDQPYWRHIYDRIHHIYALYGYRQIETPIFEETSLFVRSVLHASQEVDDGFHKTPAGTYELVVNFTVEAAPAALPETGAHPPTGTLPLWLGVGGLLLLALGLGLRRVSGHVR